MEGEGQKRGELLLLHSTKDAIIVIISRCGTASEINVCVAVLPRCPVCIAHASFTLIGDFVGEGWVVR